MIRLVIGAVVTFLANAIGLMAAAYLLDDFEINTSSFIIAVLIFTIATIILGPLVIKIALTAAPYLMGGIALVTTLVGLIIADVASDGFSIDGISTWIAATVIIWFCAMIASLLIPWILVKAGIGADSSTDSSPPAPTVPPAVKA